LVLPAAAARNLSSNIRSYTIWAIVLSMISVVIGLAVSFYLGTASGATIVLFSAGFYILSLFFGNIFKK
ncbi:MAG: metal ABC transporter permease, partial [Candidatus Margulisiibacteriota bacterium]